MSPKTGDYDRPIKAGLAAEECVVEVWGGLGKSTEGLIRKAAEQRANKLTHAEFEREATWDLESQHAHAGRHPCTCMPQQ